MIFVLTLGAQYSLTTPEIRKFLGLDRGQPKPAVVDTIPEPQRSIAKKTEEIPKSELPSSVSDSHPKTVVRAKTIEDSLGISNKKEWSQNYLKPLKKGTYHVFVRSLDIDADQDEANAELKRLEEQFLNVVFEIMPTVASDGESNKRFAIIVGRGLTLREAVMLAEKVKRLGIASDVYYYCQTWDIE